MEIKENAVSELNELIDLAEKSSNSAKLYQEKIINSQALLYFCTVCVVGLISIAFLKVDNFFSVNIGILLISVLLIWLFLFTFFWRQISKYKRELKVETNVLKKLIELIYNLFTNITNNNRLSDLEKVIIEMRLSRLSFSTNYDRLYY